MIMATLLAGIGAFVTTTPSAPAPATLQASAARRLARRRRVDGLGDRRARVVGARQTPAELRRTAGTDALDGGSAARSTGRRQPRRAPAPRPPAKPTTAPGGAGTEPPRPVAPPAPRPARSVATTRPTPTGRASSTAATSRCSRTRRPRTSRTSPTRRASTAPPGPADDDGIACSLLPVDPARPASAPAGRSRRRLRRSPRALPTTPTMRGAARADGSTTSASRRRRPRSTGRSSRSSRPRRRSCRACSSSSRAGTATSRGTRSIETWRRGVLPVISWEPRPTVQPAAPTATRPVEPTATRSRRSSTASHDEYIDRVRDRGARPRAARRDPLRPRDERQLVPVVRGGATATRRASTCRRGATSTTASPPLGATNAIWIWSPNVITARPSVDLAPLYPGDDYVDWMGMVGYYRRVLRRRPGQPEAGRRSTTRTRARSTSCGPSRSKPIVLTEVGATEVGGNKPAWITQPVPGHGRQPGHHRVRVVRPQRQRHRLAHRVVGRGLDARSRTGWPTPVPRRRRSDRRGRAPDLGRLRRDRRLGYGPCAARLRRHVRACANASRASDPTGPASTGRPAPRWWTPRSTRCATT